MNHDSITLSSRIKKNKKCVNRATCLVFYINKISLTGASSNFLCFRVFNLRLMYHITLQVSVITILPLKPTKIGPKGGGRGIPRLRKFVVAKSLREYHTLIETVPTNIYLFNFHRR